MSTAEWMRDIPNSPIRWKPGYPLVTRLAALDGEPLQNLVLELVERVPSLVGLVETALTLLELAPEPVAVSTISTDTDNAHADTSQVPYLRR